MTLTGRTILSLAVTTGLVGGALAAPASQGGRKFTTNLTGEAEVTAAGVPNQGDLSATRTATITVNPGQSRVCWEITTGDDFTAGTTSIVGAHIHVGASTTTGPVVVPLTATIDGTTTGCADVTRELADAIRKTPENYYVNVHTNLFPAGAIRGQLG
jgi:hypothetical protein